MTDLDLRKNVESELHWEPSVDAAEIEIASKAGVVTLSGSVQSYWERTAAEQATLRVFGVKAIANELEIRLPSASERTDEDLARAAATSLTRLRPYLRNELRLKFPKAGSRSRER